MLSTSLVLFFVLTFPVLVFASYLLFTPHILLPFFLYLFSLTTLFLLAFPSTSPQTDPPISLLLHPSLPPSPHPLPSKSSTLSLPSRVSLSLKASPTLVPPPLPPHLLPPRPPLPWSPLLYSSLSRRLSLLLSRPHLFKVFRHLFQN